MRNIRIDGGRWFALTVIGIGWYARVHRLSVYGIGWNLSFGVEPAV